MISHGKNVKVFSANANKSLAEGICRKLWLPLGDSSVTSFADGEVSMTINESVRGSDVFLVQPTCKPVNDHLMELLVMIDACKRASAGRITAVMPYFGYARQDRKAKGRDPISAKLVANMIEAAATGHTACVQAAAPPESRPAPTPPDTADKMQLAASQILRFLILLIISSLSKLKRNVVGRACPCRCNSRFV